MKYNFNSYYDRKCNGSWKWLAMYDSNEKPKTDVVPMTVADMDFPTCPKIVRGIQDYVKTQVVGYSNPTAEYLASVQHFFEREHDYIVKREWIVTSPGIVPALATAIRAYTKENEGVIILTPVYAPFYDVIEKQNRIIEECPLLLQDNRYQIDFEKLSELAKKDQTKLLILCSPHNPGGRVWTVAELREIAEIALANNIIVVSDEIHSDIMLNGNRHYIFPSVDERMNDFSVVCTAASKTFNIAGLQCSNIFIPNETLRQKFVEANLAIGIQVPNVLGMEATKIAYNECQDWLEEVREKITANQQVVTEFFGNWDSRWQVMIQDASFLAWVDYSQLKVEAQKFISFITKECDFYVNDGKMFGQASEYFIRINVGMPTHKLVENLNRLKEKCLEHGF